MKGTFLITDCETGGLDDRLNPLLSVSLLAADDDFNEVDNFEMQLKPPPGTLIEVPIPAHQDPENKKKTIAYYMDVFTGKTFNKAERPPDAMVINAVAAEINGYVEIGNNGRWNFDAIKDWNDKGMSSESADHSAAAFILGLFSHPAIGVAHNADFDSKFVSRNLPKAFAYYLDQWFCTVKYFRSWRQKTGNKGYAKLADLAAAAGYVPPAAHTAFDDCRSCLAGLKWLQEQQVQIGE